jgi:hypothetical protein
VTSVRLCYFAWLDKSPGLGIIEKGEDDDDVAVNPPFWLTLIGSAWQCFGYPGAVDGPDGRLAFERGSQKIRYR